MVAEAHADLFQKACQEFKTCGNSLRPQSFRNNFVSTCALGPVSTCTIAEWISAHRTNPQRHTEEIEQESVHRRVKQNASVNFEA